MFQRQVIQEVDVIIEVIRWLHSDGWIINTISIPRSEYVVVRKKVIEEVTTFGLNMNNVNFEYEGEDIVAIRGNTVWKIECKGLSGGKYQTDKNNFDRAVASVVSYYTQSKGLRLGLALPEYYQRFFPNRLPQTLRIALNLWVFLYCGRDEIYEFAPNEEIPVGNYKT